MLRAIPPPPFLKEIVNLFEIWEAETHGKMHAFSTMLHGGGLGRSPPQGHSPNDMVDCVCNLPYAGFSGVLWRSGGVMEVLGWIGGMQGGTEGGPGRF